MARPRIAPESRRSRIVAVKVTKAEAAKWKAKADRLGQTVSAWLRNLANRDARM